MRVAVIICVVLLTGCDYKPRETFTIATTDGREIRLTCPVVESQRSSATYFIDGHCVVEPNEQN